MGWSDIPLPRLPSEFVFRVFHSADVANNSKERNVLAVCQRRSMVFVVNDPLLTNHQAVTVNVSRSSSANS